MVRNLSWKAKAVNSILCIALFISFDLQAQTSRVVNHTIDFSCHNDNFDHVIDRLTKVTGLRFIYSSNMIQTDRLFSFSVRNKSLNEALQLIGDAMNLDLNKIDQYVVVKARKHATKATNFVSTKKPAPDRSLNPATVESLKVEPFKDTRELFASCCDTLLSPSRFISMYGAALHPDHHPALSNFPLTQNVLERKHRPVNWFVSLGSTVNDFSAGMELRFGIRPAYLVFNPTWLSDGEFRGGYGIGSSIAVKKNLTLDPVYTYARISDKLEFRGPFLDGIDMSVSHHQMKLMINYSFAKNFNILFGPTINYAKISYDFPEVKFLFIRNAVTSSGAGSYTEAYTIRNSASPLMNLRLVSSRSDLWMGWEAGAQYRINFFRRR